MKSLVLLPLLFMIHQFSLAQLVEWEAQESGVSDHLRDVFFLNSETGYAVGDEGTIIKTTNGGEEWNTMETNFSESITSCWFLDEFNGFVVGGGNKIYRTEDGAITWLEVANGLSSEPWQVANDIHFVNENIGFIGANDGMLRTVDGGLTWTTYNTDLSLIEKIDFIGTEIGYASSNNGILKTTDSGISWNVHVSITHPDFNAGSIVRSIQATSIDTVYFGASYYSAFYSSFDGAESLNYQIVSTHDLNFLNSSIGYSIVLSENFTYQIRKTIDASETWDVQFESENSEMDVLTELFMLNENEGWAVGENGTIRHLVDSSVNSISESPELLFNIYPNPAHTHIHVNTNEANPNVQLQIYNTSGVLVIEESLHLTTDVIDISSLPAGVYIAYVSNGENSTFKQLAIR